MEPRRAPEYTLEVFADPTCVQDVVKAILHTIFFHRYFTPLTPVFRDLLDTTLPTVEDDELEAMMEQRVASLVKSMQSSSSSSRPPLSYDSAPSGGYAGGRARSQQQQQYPRVVDELPNGRGQLAVSFYERKRRKTYFFGKGEEDICWETWVLDVTCATPRTDSEKYKVRRAMATSLQKSAFKIIMIVNRDKDHIPPITTTDSNPFPYNISVGGGGRGNGNASPRMGLF